MFGLLGLLFGVLGFTKANQIEKDFKELKRQINNNDIDNKNKAH